MSEMLRRTVYMPGHEPITTYDYVPTEEDYELMSRAIKLGKLAIETGDTPVGTVMKHEISGIIWEDKNNEFSENNLSGHPEEIVIAKAQPLVGRDLSRCVMYTTTEPCYGCTYKIDKGNLGTLYVAAMRDDVEFFRNKKPNMDSALRESRRNFIVISGLLLNEAKELYKPEYNVHHLVP